MASRQCPTTPAAAVIAASATSFAAASAAAIARVVVEARIRCIFRCIVRDVGCGIEGVGHVRRRRATHAPSFVPGLHQGNNRPTT